MELFKLLGTIAIDNTKAKNALDDTKRSANDTDDALDKTDKSSRSLAKGGFSVLKGAAANLVANGLSLVVNALGELASSAVSYQSQMEQYTTSFKTMTGSAEKAAEVTKRLQELGAETPFEMTDLADTTQLLMNYGFEADNAVDKMTMLGDISQGNADKLNRIAMAYGQMSSAGKVSLEDVKQMIEAGFNPLQEICDSTGESMDSLYTRISKGTLSVDEITAAMERATSEGGKYYGAMAAQSETLSGRLSTLKDTINSSLGTAFSGILEKLSSEILPKITNALSNFDWASIGSFLGSTLDSIMQIAGPLASIGGTLLLAIGQLLQSLLPAFSEICGAILPIFSDILSRIFPPLLQIVDMVLPILVQLISACADIISPIIELLTPLFDLIMIILQPLLDLLNIILPPLISVLTAVANVLSAVLGPILKGIGAVLSKVGEAFGKLKDAASKKMGEMKASIEEHGGGIKGFFGAMGESMKENWEKSFNKIDELTGGKLSAMRSKIEENGGGIKGFFTTVGQSMKDKWSENFNKMDELTGGKLGNMLNSVKEKIGNIKDNMTEKFNEAKDKVLDIFEKIKSGIMDRINKAKEIVTNVIDKIKGIFNFEFKIPKIKLPHFKITPSGWELEDLLEGSIPKLGIEWYAKGGVMEEPTAFGMNGSNVMVGGEAGPEAVAPISTLQKYIEEAVAVNDSRIAESINNNFERLLAFLQQYIPDMANTQVVMDSGALVGALAPGMDSALGKMAIRNGRGV